MNHNIKKVSIVFVFATLFMITVSSAQAAESIWFAGSEGYKPAANYLDGGFCYNATFSSENIYFAGTGAPRQEAIPGTCNLKDGKSYSIWFQNNSSS